MFKRIGITAVIVLLIGVAGFTFMSKTWNGLVSDSSKKVIEDHSFTNIEVFADNAAVEIVPTKDSEVTVEYSGKTKKKSKFIFEADVKGDTLSIQFKEKRRSFIHFGFPSFDLTLT